MKLPSFIFKKVKEHKTSLGNNEAFPPEEDFPFDYKILKTRFEEVINKINEYEDIESLEENYLISLLNKLITQCKEKENPIKEHIEKLCEKIVSETFRIPNETINLNIKLTDKLSPSKQFNLTPPTSKERTFDFEDLNDFKDSEKVILKRRLINSLIQGASYEYSTKTVMHLDEISSLLSDLKPLYERIIAINDFLLFTKKESITDDKIHQGAIVEVLLGRGNEKTEINVQGLIFPFLLNETFRGMFELFAAHGLPQDIDKANYILQQADFLLAEPWDLRMGVTLWNILSENVYGYESMPYFFMSLCEINTDEFNLNLKEVFAQTKKGKQFIIDLNEYALKEAEYNSNIEPNEISSENDALMTDSYISSNDLDLYYLTDDELNNNVIEEGGNTPNKLQLLKEFFGFYGNENQSNADNVIIKDKDIHLLWDDNGAYPFCWIDDELYIGDESTMHSSPALKAVYDDVNNKILNDGCNADIDGTFNDELDGYNEYEFLHHPYDEEYREEYEIEEGQEDFFHERYYLIGDWISYNHTESELNGMLEYMDISGRYWEYDKVISFWSSMTPEIMRNCIKELSERTKIDFSNYIYVYTDYETDEFKYCTISEFINSNEEMEFKPDERENKGIHLMNQQNKRNALSDFRQNRAEVQGRKLGKIPMAQYHNMIYQESKENNNKLISENSFESWFGNSVLVDNEGKPIKMYHGTKNKFDEFSKDFIGATGSYEGYGFNFTPFEGRAANYNNENVIEAYLRAENPMTSKSYKITPSKLAKIIAELDKGKPYTDTIVAAYEPSRYNEKWDAMYYRRALPVAAKMIYQYNKENDYGDAGLYAEICVNGNADKYQVIELFEKLGYDSVIFYDNDDRINTVIVFEPNQIKLVSNKTFNNNSNLMHENKTNNIKKIYINESQLS